MPNFNGQGSPSFAQGPKGLADMLASALRGGVKATLGMPGDVERLGRMGINALGGSVDPQAALPTTEDWDKRLPPVNPMTGQSFKQVENLGEFLPLNAAGPIMSAAGKANSAVQALRQSVPAATNMGRRTALKGIGAAGASAAVAPELVVQALRNTPATPIAAKVVAPVAAKAALKFTPDFIANSLIRHGEMWGIEGLTKDMVKAPVIESVKRMGVTPEEFANLGKWAEHEAVYDPNLGDEALSQSDRALELLRSLDSAKVRDIALKGPDNLPKELLSQGVTPSDVNAFLFPSGGRFRPNLENPHEKLTDDFNRVMSDLSDSMYE